MPSALAPSSSLSEPVAVRGAFGLRWLLGIALALGVSAWAVRAWSSAYADRLGRAIASGLSATLAPAVRLSTPSEVPAVEDDTPVGELPASRSAALEATGKKAHGKATNRPHAVGAQRGVRVSAAQVLALASRRAMPEAIPVKANAQHPAGLLLRGVSTLGVGMQDGDVLTEAAGQKATSVAVVVGIVLAARGRQAPEISGRFFRGGLPFALTVEQPYPKLPVPG